MEKEFKFSDKTGNVIIMNYSSWLSIIKGILIKYAYKTEKEAEKIGFDIIILKLAQTLAKTR